MDKHARSSSLLALRLESEGRVGRHEEFGVVSIKQQVSYFAAHEITHLPQIERLTRQKVESMEDNRP